MPRDYLQHGLYRHRPSASDPVAPDPWWTVSASPATTWSAGTTYAKGAEVSDTNSLGIVSSSTFSAYTTLANWISLQAGNVGNDPLSDGDDATPPAFWMCKELLFIDLANAGDLPVLELRLVTGPPWEAEFAHHIAFKGVTTALNYPGGGLFGVSGIGDLCWLPPGYRPNADVTVPICDGVGGTGFALYKESTNLLTLNDPLGTGDASSGWWCNFIL